LIAVDRLDRIGRVSQIILEIHVPLPTSEQLEGPHELLWIEVIEEHLATLTGPVEVFDDGEEWYTESGKAEYLFFIGGASEPELIRVAQDVSHLAEVPSGTYATINTPDGDMGIGRRIEIAAI
jgi:hypothetical protein